MRNKTSPADHAPGNQDLRPGRGPRIEQLAPAERAARISKLTDRGFTAEHLRTMASKRQGLPRIDVVDEAIAFLEESGFNDPIRVIGNFPEVLGLSQENIKGKIEGLRARGFANATDLITRMPAIFGFSFEHNIDPKLEFVTTILATMPLKQPFTAVEMFERRPRLISSSADTLTLHLGVVRSYDSETVTLPRVDMLFKGSVDQVVQAFRARTDPNETFAAFAIRLRNLQELREKKFVLESDKEQRKAALLGDLLARDSVLMELHEKFKEAASANGK